MRSMVEGADRSAEFGIRPLHRLRRSPSAAPRVRNARHPPKPRLAVRTNRAAYPLSWRVFDACRSRGRNALARALVASATLRAASPRHPRDRASPLWPDRNRRLEPSGTRQEHLPALRVPHSANYERALTQPLFRNISVRSLFGAMIVTIATLALAFPYAYVMVRTPSAATAENSAHRAVPAVLHRPGRARLWLADHPRQ